MKKIKRDKKGRFVSTGKKDKVPNKKFIKTNRRETLKKYSNSTINKSIKDSKNRKKKGFKTAQDRIIRHEKVRRKAIKKGNAPKGRVTISKSGGGYDVNVKGKGVEFGKTKKEAKFKANRIRQQQGKVPSKRYTRKTKQKPIQLMNIGNQKRNKFKRGNYKISKE